MADIRLVIVIIVTISVIIDSIVTTPTRYVSHEQRVAEYSYTSSECPWLAHHPTPSVNGPGIVIDCRYHDDDRDEDDDDDDDNVDGKDRDKDADDGIHSNQRYHSLSPCTVANVAKVIHNL